jgi:hypothetical protein
MVAVAFTKGQAIMLNEMWNNLAELDDEPFDDPPDYMLRCMVVDWPDVEEIENDEEEKIKEGK